MTRLDVIADPVRLAIVRHLGRGAASGSEVAAAVGVHTNTARAHLRALVEAGVASRRNERAAGRGRPVVRYDLERDWTPTGDELLGVAQLLAAALDGPRERVRERARRWGNRAASSHPGSVRADLAGMLTRLGFEPRVDRDELTLSNCPCPLASPGRPGLVCALVDAAIDGALRDRGLAARNRRHDPASRLCRMRLVPPASA